MQAAMKKAKQTGQDWKDLFSLEGYMLEEEGVGIGAFRPVAIPGFVRQRAPVPCLHIFAGLPTHLLSLILAHAAAPLDTCKASAAILETADHLAAWMTAAVAEERLQKPVQLAAELKQWKVCSILLQTAEIDDGDDNYDISTALWHAAEAGQLKLVEQLLAKGGWRETPWSEPLGDEVDLSDSLGCKADWHLFLLVLTISSDAQSCML
jgi:hypothetical protein